MLNYSKIAGDIDKIADSVESRGHTEAALALDKIADTLEAMAKFPPEAIQLARQLGINLTPQNAAEIVKKYHDPKADVGGPGVGGDPMKEAMMNPKMRSLVMLASILAMGFINEVAAKGKPITVNFPTGAITYDAKELKNLEKGDPKTFAIVMDQYEKQQSQAQSQSEISKTVRDQAQGAPKPGYDTKPTKNVEELNDEFGNSARLITYTDGTKSLEGDIFHGGVSLRDKLTRSGEIPHDPSAKHLGRQK
jgi:hypothetical protein